MDVFEKYVGQVFDNRYKIEKIIGIGGMAVVYKAVDMLMKRVVAVKMLKDDIANDIQSVKRFINESKAVAMLSHPNIVNIYDVSVKDNVKYIVMEYVEGITLKNYMTRKGVLSFREIMSYTEQILHALDHAHQKGIVHRDIKPQNIMLLKNGIIKVMDFGIAKLPNAETVTMTDKAIGTVYYISPEQVSGKPIDARSDLYALGVLMYEMATGKLPFTADSPVSVALMQVNETAVPPKEVNPEIPTGLEQIIIKAMEKEPDMRFQNAAMMLRQVVKLKENPKIVFKQVSSQPKGGDKKNKSAAKNEATFDDTDSNGKTVKRVRPSMFPVILGIALAFVAVVGIAAFYLVNALFFSDSGTETSLPTPTFVGEIYNDQMMKDLAEDGCYEVEIIEVFSSEYPMGYIMEQDPLPGEKRKITPNVQLCPLKLTVSKGERNGIIPDITMYDYRDAKILLTNQGFIVNSTIGEAHPTYLANTVIRTEPPIGTLVNTDEAVIIYYSTGSNLQTVMVPQFIGMSETQALNEIVTNKLEVGNVTYEESPKASGTVLTQSIQEAESVPEYTEIDFVISLGMPETKPPETEPLPPETETTALDTTDTEPPDTELPEENSESDINPPEITPPEDTDVPINNPDENNNHGNTPEETTDDPYDVR